MILYANSSYSLLFRLTILKLNSENTNLLSINRIISHFEKRFNQGATIQAAYIRPYYRH